MDKQLALKNAKYFIQETFFEETNHIDLNKPFTVRLGDKFYNADPNLEVFKEELLKLGYNMEQDPEYQHLYNISKIK